MQPNPIVEVREAAEEVDFPAWLARYVKLVREVDAQAEQRELA